MNLRISWVVTLLISQFIKLLIATTDTSNGYSQHNSIKLPCINDDDCKTSMESDFSSVSSISSNDVQFAHRNNHFIPNMRHRMKSNYNSNNNNNHHHHHNHNHDRVDELDMSKYMREMLLQNRRSQVQRQTPLKAAMADSTTTPFVVLSTTKPILLASKRTPATKSSTTRKQIRHHVDRSSKSSISTSTKSAITYNAVENSNSRRVNRTSLPLDKQCVLGLKQQDSHSWSCEVKYSSEIENEKPKPLFCLCSYDIDCSSSEKMYLSSEFAKQLERENHAKGVERGADYQCENMLKTKTKKRWTCALKRDQEQERITTTRSSLTSTAYAVNNNHNSKNNNNNNNKPNNDELYCDCFHKKNCKKSRMVEFF